MRATLAVILSAMFVLASNGQTVRDSYGSTDAFSDIVLIYAGDARRNTWDAAQLAPYVTHTYADGSEDWWFDAFLFLEFMRTGDGTTYGFGNGMGGERPATQSDWAWLLDQYFAPETKLSALDKLIGEKKQTLGCPPFRHKVVIVCPAPKKEGTVWSQEIWGSIEGQPISLYDETARLSAVKWYIDELVKRWDMAGYENIDLEGIYWIEEGMISNAGIIADVNDYARSRGLRSYWIPYYRSGNEPYCQRWASDFKFDMCFYQPNYAFYQTGGAVMPKSQLVTTCEAAKTYGAGVEVEFETSGASNALHSVDPAAHQRLNDYMDVYTEQGVFDSASVAYYVGSRGLNDMSASADSVDHATIDRLARIVADRHKSEASREADTLRFVTHTDQGRFEYTFKHCMANNLYTFYTVSLDGKVLNSAQHSDNIGPFLISGYGWAGGNHLSDNGTVTAKTIKLDVRLDGEHLEEGLCRGDILDVDVDNELYLPDGRIFALENVKYQASGNSIDVRVTHDFINADSLTIERYYGMQSMFVDETEILVPGAEKYNKWIGVEPCQAANSIRITHDEAPQMSLFVERSPWGYQASYMMPEGLGLRKNLGPDDEAFIGNSYGKCYHKLMANSIVHAGERTTWHGVYTWFKDPVSDTFSDQSADPHFTYPSYISGRPVTISVGADGVCTLLP